MQRLGDPGRDRPNGYNGVVPVVIAAKHESCVQVAEEIRNAKSCRR